MQTAGQRGLNVGRRSEQHPRRRTLALKGFLCPYSGVYVCTILVLGRFGIGPKKIQNIMILQNSMSGIPLVLNWALELEREILVFMWPFNHTGIQSLPDRPT